MKQFSIILSIILLITAIFDFSIGYWYYQLLKWLVCVYAGMSAYLNLQNKRVLAVYVVILILFNPIAPVYFPKEIWRIIDGVAGIMVLFLLFKDKFKQFIK